MDYIYTHLHHSLSSLSLYIIDWTALICTPLLIHYLFLIYMCVYMNSINFAFNILFLFLLNKVSKLLSVIHKIVQTFEQ